MKYNNLRLQSSFGTNVVNKSKAGSVVDKIVLARVVRVHYETNSVDFVLINGGSVSLSSDSEGTMSARLPSLFSGRNGYGNPYGEVYPIRVNNIVLIGYISGKSTSPIVIGCYSDDSISAQLSQAPEDVTNSQDPSVYASSNVKYVVYPDLTYDFHDGHGNRALTFSGKSFLLVDADVETGDPRDDTETPKQYTDIKGNSYANGEVLEPLVDTAPDVLFRHSGIVGTDGKPDKHAFYVHISKDGTARISQMKDDEDWRTYFEQTPSGKIRIRRQEDSKDFGGGKLSSEIGIDENGYVTIRSQSNGIIVRPDGLYNVDGTKFSVDTDLTEINERLDSQDKSIKQNTASIKIQADQIKTKVSTEDLPSAIQTEMKPYTDELNSLSTNVDALKKTVDDIGKDGIISGSDRKAIRTIWLQIENNYPALVARATSTGVDHSAYDGAYNTLKTYIEPILNATGNTVVNPTDWDNNFTNYYNAEYALTSDIVTHLKQKAQDAYDKAVNAGADANNALTGLSQVSSADYLTLSDKSSIARAWSDIQYKYPQNVKMADDVSVPHTAYDSAYNDLNSYITSNNVVSGDASEIDSTTLNNKFSAYYNEESALLKAVADANLKVLEEFGQDINHMDTSITETSKQIQLNAENIQKSKDSLMAAQGNLSVEAGRIDGTVSETDVTGLVNDSLAGTSLGNTNQFVVNTATTGKYLVGSTGAETDLASGVESDFIDISSSISYSARVYDISSTTKLSIAWYNASKSFISGIENANNSDFSVDSTAPDTATYAKVSTNDNTKSVMFIAGEAPTSWSPSYADASKNVADMNALLKSIQSQDNDVISKINANSNQQETNVPSVDSYFSEKTSTENGRGFVNGLVSTINGYYSEDLSVASELGVDTASYTSYYNSLSSIVTTISESNNGDSIDTDDLKVRLDGYYTSRNTLLEALKSKLDTQVEAAQQSVSNAVASSNRVITNKYANFSETVDGINSTVKSTTSDLSALQKSTTEKFSEIDQTTGSITQTVSETTTIANAAQSTANDASDKINNLQVGGTNLLPNTIDFSSWQMSSGVSIDSTIYPEVAHYPSSTAGSADIDFLQYASLTSLVANTTYTFSFSAKGSGNLNVLIYPDVSASGSTDNFHQYALTSTYQKYSFTFTTSSNISGTKNVLFRDSKGDTLEAYITQVKLEQGNIATDWSPAPNDGLGIKSTTIMYQLGDSGTTPPNGTWLEAVPTLVKGLYLWTRTTLIYTDNSSESIYSVTYIAKDGNDGADGTSPINLVIDSSNGYQFKNNIINTTFTAILYQDNKEIDSDGTKFAYVWSKTNADGTADTAWNLAHQTSQKSITITSSDVLRRATFDCTAESLN